MSPRTSSTTQLRDLELAVLLALMGSGAEAYPLEIRNAIAARTGREVSRAAVFITLERLEDKALVTSRYGDPSPVRGGRAKRFFRATPRGIAAAKHSVDMVASMSKGLDELWRKS
jgi:DNA-binding PadR family transcriptional regulator